MESEENNQKHGVSLLIICIDIFKPIYKIPEVLRCFIFYNVTQKYDFFLYAEKTIENIDLEHLKTKH